LIGVLNGSAVLASDTDNIKGTLAVPADPRLGPLQDYGGPTRTMALLAGSPAIDAGSNELAAGLTTEQRGAGFPRVVNGRVDMGSFEFGAGRVVVGAGPGGAPHVKVIGASGVLELSFFAFDPGFTGGVHVATADVNGDTIDDIVAGAGPGGAPHVRVFDGRTGSELASFFAYDPSFRNGVFVGAADINGDGFAEVVTGAGAGGAPHVRVFDLHGGTELASFFAFDPSLRTGSVVAALPGLIVAAPASGPSPHVRVFHSADLVEVASFFAFDPGAGNGVKLAGFDGRIAVGTGPGREPLVAIFKPDGTAEAIFAVLSPGFSGGTDIGIRGADLAVGAGPGAAPLVQVYDVSGTLVEQFLAFDPAFTGGVSVG
jgi:hypothetical protein